MGALFYAHAIDLHNFDDTSGMREVPSNFLNERSGGIMELENQNTLKNTIYSVGVDRTPNLRERILEVHGKDSEPAKAADELDRYVSDPEIRESGWYRNFFNKLRSAMWALYPHSNGFVRTQMAGEFIDEVFNGGYVREMQALANPSAARHAMFSAEYAKRYSAPLGAALMFGPRGGAVLELWNFLAAQRIHGQHRPCTSPNPLWTEETKSMWHNANKIYNWPEMKDEDGRYISMDVAEDKGYLPVGVIEKLRQLWRRNPALRDYCGTKRLSGDIPFQIIEDVIDILVQKRYSGLTKEDKDRYDRICEDANKAGVDTFYAVYKELFAGKERLKPLWNKARKLLYDYSLSLWETKNEFWLSEGKRIPATGVVYKPARTSAGKKSPKKKVPGTIYLNNGRYYWVVARKMAPKPLIDPKSKPKVPGTIFKDGNRWYWFIPRWLKRQRLVPDGEKFSTTDRAAAERIALKIWRQLKKDDPAHAAKILAHTRSSGLATKDKALAEKIAQKMWKDIQKNNPKLAAKILTDNRPKATDHWHAQIKTGRTVRFIGSYKTREEANAAYLKEFEKVHGYLAGYNVQCIPKIDKVWPTWTEEKMRLALMDEHPKMPVIGKSQNRQTLEPVIKQMQKIDWVVDNCMVVFDDDHPAAMDDVAIDSRGEHWLAEIKKQHKRPVIQGSASIDKQSQRIKITIYGQGAEYKQVIIEEVYHIVFEIIKNASPKTFASIRKWYAGQIKKEIDPTWQMHEAFAELMVQESQKPETTSLPRNVVSYAQKVFSPSNKVAQPVMENILADA